MYTIEIDKKGGKANKEQSKAGKAAWAKLSAEEGSRPMVWTPSPRRYSPTGVPYCRVTRIWVRAPAMLKVLLKLKIQQHPSKF